MIRWPVFSIVPLYFFYVIALFFSIFIFSPFFSLNFIFQAIFILKSSSTQLGCYSVSSILFSSLFGKPFSFLFGKHETNEKKMSHFSDLYISVNKKRVYGAHVFM